MVRRYNYCEGDEDMCEDIHGAYVSYHDYADLEAENARLKEALREMAEVLERFTCPECDPTSTVCRAVGGVPCQVVMAPRKAREVLGDEEAKA